MTDTLTDADLERHALDNGLKVVLHHDPAIPLVAINLWYHVGSKNERRGRTGFAHLFEHLLFQGSANVDANEHFRYVQQAGGVANGSTWFDRTNYHEVLPSHQLDLGMWLESDRMGFFLPAITQEKLETQRDVVINERRQKMDNQPYGLAFERLHEQLYLENHPYSWPVIGYIPDIEAATLDDVRDFFRTYYAPNNAVLTLAGDFDRGRALDSIARYFGDIPPTGPVPRPQIPQESKSGVRREVLEDKVHLPRLYMAFQGPAYGEDAWYAGDILTAALASGKSSLLYRDLIYERQLAQDVGCFLFPTEVEATFTFMITARPGVELMDIERAVFEHLETIRRGELPEDQLDRSRNRLLTSYYHDLQSLDQRADLLSHFTTFFDAPELVFRQGSRYRAVQNADLTAFVNRYLTPENRAVVHVVPKKDPS